MSNRKFLPKLTPCLLVLFVPAVSEGLVTMEVCVGDSITLPFNGTADTDPQSVEVVWRTEKGIVCQFIEGKFTEDHGYENRTALRNILNNDFSLTIKSALMSDDEEYSCDVNNQPPHDIRLFVRASGEPRCVGKKMPDDLEPTVSPNEQVTVTGRDPESPADRNRPGLIAGGVAAVLVLVLVLVLGAVLLILRRRGRNREPDNDVI